MNFKRPRTCNETHEERTKQISEIISQIYLWFKFLMRLVLCAVSYFVSMHKLDSTLNKRKRNRKNNFVRRGIPLRQIWERMSFDNEHEPNKNVLWLAKWQNVNCEWNISSICTNSTILIRSPCFLLSRASLNIQPKHFSVPEISVNNKISLRERIKERKQFYASIEHICDASRSSSMAFECFFLSTRS